MSRLRLEAVGEHHLPLLVMLNSDPEVMRYVENRRPATPDEVAAEWERRLGPQSDAARGLGCWAGFEGDDFVGWWSASAFAEDATTAGLGYRLVRTAWGRGLATEGGRAMLDRAFAASGVERVVASAMAVNTGSRRVLAKLGLRHVRTWVEDWPEPIPGSELGEVGYEIDRAAWVAKGSTTGGRACRDP